MSRLLSGPPHETIALQLLLWSLLWMGAAVVGLWKEGRERRRAFWFMSGIWALVDAAIAFAGLLGRPLEPEALRRLLFINAGLDVLYLLAGVWLLTRSRPLLQGFGAAILVQGAFLLLFDLLHAWAISM